MASAFHYPDENAPTISYIPAIDPTIEGSANPDRSGLNYQRTADGELQGDAQHDVRWSVRRRFTTASEAKRNERDAFFAATRGLPVRYIDETIDDYKTVKMIGESIDGEWRPTEGDYWERVEGLEETTDMPDISELGDTRAGTVTFAGTEATKTATLSTPYEDALYHVILTTFLASTGEAIPAWPVLPLAASGFDIKLAIAPGSGETVRVDFLTIHQ
jgi:hypothetical protein